jgi:hypothetical protein
MAIVMAAEPVAVGLVSFALAGEKLGVTTILGGIAILAAIPAPLDRSMRSSDRLPPA